MQIPAAVLRGALRTVRPMFATERLSIGVKRRVVDVIGGVSRPPRGVPIVKYRLANVPVERLTPPGGGPAGVLIYLHGGGYALGSARGYRGIAARLAIAGQFEVITVDYSRSPEAQFPTALHEARDVFMALVDSGRDPKRIVIAGDSAGGGLALSLAKYLRDESCPAPAALGLICPWMDLVSDSNGTRMNRTDPLIETGMIRDWLVPYVGTGDVHNPLVSPVYGDLSGLPPIVMQSSGDDPIGADADLLEDLLSGAGVSDEVFRHRRHPGLWHVFHLQAGFLPQADAALEHLGTSLREVADCGKFVS
ncbi:alpha/beta hydrolase [Arthrobacter sp. GMC3]|uniref:alpha/beta hydrolase n=1 Tax=Arthrobacter sp. GMC3 TaxID=2058894 RepID=UPI000CE2E70A|nr:alpha/beta hydrolase [Arthrobacter sp. GMC3]